MPVRLTFAAAILGGVVAMAGGWAVAAEPATGLATRPWDLEAIELADGRRLEGLVVAPADAAGVPRHDAEDVEFVQVVRPPGRPMHLVAWPPFDAAGVRFIERLAPAERQ